MRHNTAELWKSLPQHVLVYAGALAVQGILSIALLPIATTVLGPTDYGVYAYAMTVMGMAVAFSDPGAGVVLPRRKGKLSDPDFKKLQTTCLLTSGGIASAGAVLIAHEWNFLSVFLGSDVILSGVGTVMLCASIPMRAVMAMGTTMLVIDSKSMYVGIMLVVQAFASFAFTLFGIFFVKIGGDALLLGNAAGAASGMLCMLLLMRKRLGLPQLKWLVELGSAIPSTFSAALMDGLRPIVESAALVRGSGIASLGIFNHSRMYYSYAMQLTNAFAYGLWPYALAAAREDDSFSMVRRAWRVVYLCLTMLGLVLAAYGAELIGLITNGKFIPAAPWAAIWMAYLLIQNSGKLSAAVMFASGLGGKVMRLRAATVFLAICVLAVTNLDVYLIIVIAFVEIIVFRLLIALYSRKIRVVFNGDAWPFGGALLVGVITLVIQEFDLNILYRSSLFMLILTCLILVARGVISDVVSMFFIFFAARSSREKST